MVEAKKRLRAMDGLASLVFPLFFLPLCFAYLYWRIDPKLIYQLQEPVFFFDLHFALGFLKTPGGINDLLARLLSQFFYYSWTGALLLVLLCGLVAWNTNRLLKQIGLIRPVLYLPWIPVTLLLALHSDYTYPLVFTTGLLWILLGANAYVRFAPSDNTRRFLVIIALHSALYYLTANLAFVFSLTIILYELFSRRKIILPIFYLIFAGMLPYVGSLTFIVSLQDAYRLQLFFYDDTYKVTWLSWTLYAFFPFVLLLKVLANQYAAGRKTKTIDVLENLLHRRSTAILLLQAFVLLIFAFGMLWHFYNEGKKSFLQIDHYARIGAWEKILAIVQQGQSGRSVVESQAYRALYHSGRLCDDFITYTRHFAGDGLFMPGSMTALFPRQHSDLFFDLGVLNESEHWAYEAIAAKGETAWNLERLVLVNMLEGNNDVAARYLAKLKKTVWHRAWATRYQQVLADSLNLLDSPEFRYLKNAAPTADFLVSTPEPWLCLGDLVQVPGNKMAFEYYMANCLLEGDISHFIQQVHRLNDFGYTKIPRHFEEAILVYIQLTGRKNVGLTGLNIADATIREFIDFNQILDKHGKNAPKAFRELEKYRGTYWFYALYEYRPKG